jgi:hypothetical protein
MDPLPHNPRTFREAVEADLRHAARIIIEVQGKLDPQFRIAAPEGDYCLAVAFPNDKRHRAAMLDRIRRFLVWKQAIAFTLASELVAPDAVRCVGISFHERHACISRITREPRPWTSGSFGPVEWLPADRIGPVIPSLLPDEGFALTNEEIAELKAWFGPRGKFPAMRVGTGRKGM